MPQFSGAAAQIKITEPLTVTAKKPSILTAELYGADLTVAQSVTLDLGAEGRDNIEIIGRSSVATTFTLEASADNVNWYTIETFSAVTLAHAGYNNAFRYIRLSSAAAGAATDTVDLVITATE